MEVRQRFAVLGSRPRLRLAGEELLGAALMQIGMVPLSLRLATVGKLVNVAGVTAENARDRVPLLGAPQRMEGFLAVGCAAAIVDRVLTLIVLGVKGILPGWRQRPITAV